MKRKIIGLIVSASCILLVGCQNVQESSYRSGMSAVEANDFATAQTLFEKALADGESAKSVYRGKGIAYLGAGEYKDAIKAFEEALAQSNGIVEEADIDISYYLAVAFYKDGQINEAVNTLNSIIAIKPERAQAYYLRGKIELIQGSLDAALHDYDKAVSLEQYDYDNYIRICEDLREAGYESESNAYIDKAMSLGKGLTDYRKGILEYYIGDYSSARTDLENARKSDKGDNILLYLGKTYEALGDTDYAKSLYMDALAANNSSGKLYNQLAMCQINEGDYEAAIDTIENGLSSGNGESMQGLMFNRVVAYEKIYDFSSAKQYIQEYLNAYPDDEVALREEVFLRTR